MAKLRVDQALIRARSHERKGEIEEARRLYQRVIESFPGNQRARQALARLDKPGQATASGQSPPQEALDYLIGLYGQGRLDAVAGQAERLAQEFPDSFALWNLLGAAAAQTGKVAIAEKAFRRAAELNPGYPDAYNNLGNIFKDQGRLDEAAASYSRALELKPDFAAAHNNLGNTLRDQGKPDEAAASYSRALELKPDFAEAHFNLFELFEKSNRLDSARDVIENMQRVFPVLPAELKLRKAMYHFRMKEFDSVISEIQGMAEKSLGNTLEIKRLELLSKSLEKIRNYKDALLYMRRMNMLIESTYKELDEPASRYLENSEKRRQGLRSASREKLANRFKSDQAAQIFLIGYPRSGTTLLDTFLRGHPQIEVIEEKHMLTRAISHIGEFCTLDRIEGLDEDQLNIMRGLYFDELKKHVAVGGKKIVIDKFPLNLIRAPEMHALFPHAKYILALRHPLDCMLSNYKQNYQLNAPMYLMSDLSRVSALYDSAMSIFHLCKERYTLDVHSVRYEDLTNDSEGVLRSLVSFLGIEWNSNILNHKSTAIRRRMINTPSYSQVTEDVYKDSNNLWQKYEELLKPYAPGLQYWIDKFGYA